MMTYKVIRKKRTTPPNDLDRLADNFWQFKKGTFRNREEFDYQYDDYCGENRTEFTDNSRDAVWDIIISKPQITKITDIEAKPVKSGKPKQFTVQKRILDVPARVKNSYVYAERIKVTRNKKEVIAYRDAKGRFAKIIKK